MKKSHFSIIQLPASEKMQTHKTKAKPPTEQIQNNFNRFTAQFFHLVQSGKKTQPFHKTTTPMSGIYLCWSVLLTLGNLYMCIL